MFDRLIESETQSTDFHNRRLYFMVSSGVVAILFSTAVVMSIFAADYGLGTQSFELAEMIAPDDLATVEPDPPNPRQQAQISPPSSNQIATRQINMARIEEGLIAVPTEVSTTKITQMTRPNIDRFQIGPQNTDTIGRSGRESVSTGPGGPVAAESLAVAKTLTDVDEVPPPAAKKPEPPKGPVSRGVLNGKAKDLPKPAYSAAAKAVGAAGQVNVQVIIDETGRVVSAYAMNGHVMLRAAAEAAARNARFTPTLLSDVPVKVTGIITYNFTR